MIRFKGLKTVKDMPQRGIYTKIGKTIIEQFQKSQKDKAEVDVEYKKPRELLSLYNAIKSLIRRGEANDIIVSIDRKAGKLYLAKEEN